VVVGPGSTYIDYAKQIGAKAFNIDRDVYEQLPKGAGWFLNKEFLDEALRRGATIIQAPGVFRRGGGWEKELKYLYKNGLKPQGPGKAFVPR
jgi:hypothetical protein